MSKESPFRLMVPEMRDMCFCLKLARNLDLQDGIKKYLEDPTELNRAQLMHVFLQEARRLAKREEMKASDRFEDVSKNALLDQMEAVQAFRAMMEVINKEQKFRESASGSAFGSASGASGSAFGSASGASGSASGASGSAFGSASGASGSAFGPLKWLGLPRSERPSETKKHLAGNRVEDILKVTQQFNDALKTLVEKAQNAGFINLHSKGQAILATLPDTGKAEEGQTLVQAAEDFKKKLHSLTDTVVKYGFMAADERDEILAVTAFDSEKAAESAGTARKDRESSPEVVFISESKENPKKKRKTEKSLNAVATLSDTEEVPKPKAKKNLKKKQESLKKKDKVPTISSRSENSFVVSDDESPFESDVSDTESSGDQSYKNPKKMDARRRSLRPRDDDKNYRDADDDDDF